MSDSAAPRYTFAANLRWFAAIYFGVSLVASAGLIAALYLWPNFNPPSTGLSIGIYIGVVYAAGMRFKDRTAGTWTSRDRNWLAVGYSAISLVASVLIVLIAFPFDPGTRDAIALVASDGAVAITIAIPIIFFASWVAARLALSMIARRGGNK